MPATIYALADPSAPSIPKYIGRTAGNVRKRLHAHFKDAFEGDYILASPRRLISLWDMIQFIGVEAMKACAEFQGQIELFQSLKDSAPAEKITEGHCKTIARQLRYANEVIQKLNLLTSKQKIDGINYELELWPHSHNFSQVYTLLFELWKSFTFELKGAKFAFIPKAKEQYFEHNCLFSGEVLMAFPSAQLHIKNAGNAIVFDLHDAAIFYLMRVAEVGMRGLAKHLKVKVQKTKKAKAAIVCPHCTGVVTSAIPERTMQVALDYAMWEEVLMALEKKIGNIQKSKKGKSRDERYQFYHGLIIELNAFKDLWRNPVSHCRRDFGEPEVGQAYPHVRDFMKRLATKVSEKN